MTQPQSFRRHRASGRVTHHNRHDGWESREPRVDTGDHLGLVHAVARQFSDRPGLDLDERISIGVQGLEKAARIFDPKLGLKFSTLASTWIWSVINRAYELEGFAGRNKKNIPEGRKVRRMHLSQMRDEGARPIDMPALDRSREYEDDEQAAWIWSHVDALPERDARVVRWRVEGRTFAEISLDLGVSRERVRQIEKRALKILRFGRLARVA